MHQNITKPSRAPNPSTPYGVSTLGQILLLFVVALISCGGPSTKQVNEDLDSVSELPNITPDLEKPKRVRRLLWADRSRPASKLALATARDYQFVHQDTEVILGFADEVIPYWGEDRAMVRYVSSMIRDGVYLWDAIIINNTWALEIATELNDPHWASRELVDFSKVPGFFEGHKPFIANDPYYKEQTDGIHVGPYAVGIYHQMVYNLEVANTLGIRVRGFSLTVDAIITQLRILSEYNNRNDEKISAFYVSNHRAGALFQRLYISSLEEPEAPHATDGGHWGSNREAAMKKSFEILETIGRLGEVRPDKPGMMTAYTEMLEGKSLFWVGDSNSNVLYARLAQKKNVKILPVELPSFEELGFYQGTYLTSIAVFQNAPGREAAIEFALSTITPKMAEQVVRRLNNLTGFRGNVAKPFSNPDVFGVFQKGLGVRYHDRVHFFDGFEYVLGEGQNRLNDKFEDLLVELLMGQISADDALNRVVGWVKDPAPAGSQSLKYRSESPRATD